MPNSVLLMENPETQKRYVQNGKIMLAVSPILFLIIMLLLFLHTCYRPSCFRRRRNSTLHSSVLNVLPTFTYSSSTHRPLEDCAVCLSEFVDGDEGRVLPNCNHAFHSHCIDPWFRSQDNCPLCRTQVRGQVQPRVTPVQPELIASSSVEPGSVGFSSLPAPIGCPRKSLELVSVIDELEDRRRRDSDPESGRMGRII